MTFNLFENDSEKAEARKDLDDLTKHPGWKWILKALDGNILHLEQQLRETRDFSHLEAVYALQDRLSDMQVYKQLPAIIIREAQEDPAAEEDSPDPYEQPEDLSPRK